MRNYLIPAILSLSLVAAGSAFAIDDDWVGGNRLNVPKDQWLSAGQISEKLTTQGYRVHEIEVDDGAYEVELIDKNGTRVDAHVHPATAEILIGYDD